MRKIAAVVALGLTLAMSGCGNAENIGKMSCKEFLEKAQSDPKSMERDADAFARSHGIDSESEAQEFGLKIAGFCIDPANQDKTIEEAVTSSK